MYILNVYARACTCVRVYVCAREAKANILIFGAKNFIVQDLPEFILILTIWGWD